MLKTFKLHTINLTNEIFNSENQNGEAIFSYSKIPHSYNKRFKYSYNRSKKEAASHKKQINKTIDIDQLYTKEDSMQRLSEQFVSNIIDDHKQKFNKLRNVKTPTPKYVNHFINQEKKIIQHLNINHTKRGRQQIKKHFKSKTERIERGQIGNQQNPTNQIDNDNLQSSNEFEQKAHLMEQKSNQNGIDPARLMRGQQLVEHAQGLVKSRGASKNKYINSIIKSYKIKSIQLTNPLENRTRRFSSNNVMPAMHSYYIDVGNEDNLKEIYLEDIQRIQLQKIKYDHHRTYSTHNCKKRPQTSQISSKVEDFAPMPWQSEEKQEEIFTKANQQM